MTALLHMCANFPYSAYIDMIAGDILSSDFASFNFDDDTDIANKSPAPTDRLMAYLDDNITGLEKENHVADKAPSAPAAQGALASPSANHVSATPSAKLQRRFSMSTTKDVFGSFVETKPPQTPHGKPEKAVPAAYRDISEDGAPIHNPRHLRMASTLKAFSTNSVNNLAIFEKEEIEIRMRRCLKFAAKAVQNKFVDQGAATHADPDMEGFDERIIEKESTIKNTAEYMKVYNILHNK